MKAIKKTINTISLLLLCYTAFSQNLVPNFSFEEYTTCPFEQDQIEFATGWSKYSTAISTPDYYNACSASNLWGVPQSKGDYQEAHRNCSAYAGIVTWGASGNDREYIGIQLAQPMNIGQKYYFSFYTVMGRVFFGGIHFGMPSNNIGMRLSTIEFSENNPAPIDNFAHIHSSAVINDSTTWVRISGSIVADSAYSYAMVGNFFDDSNTDTANYLGSSYFNSVSYYFVDDICVSTDSLLCNGGVDTIPCDISLGENANSESPVIKIFPNPTSDKIFVVFDANENTQIELCNIYGTVVKDETTFNKNTIEIDLNTISSGYYILKIKHLKNNHQITKTIIKTQN